MYILGIDFGTTNSCVTITDVSTPITEYKVLENDLGYRTTPSILFISDQKDIYIGEIASTISKTQSGLLISNFKRLLGVTYRDYVSNEQLKNFFEKKGNQIVNQSGYCAISYKDNIYTIQSLVSLYIEKLLQVTIKQNDANIKAVITIPAYFNNTQRQILQKSCESITGLNLDIIRIINEPTAAALCYGIIECGSELQESYQIAKQEIVMVIDCGGGTTDISVISMDYQNYIFSVLETKGDNYKGGEDLTLLIYDWILNYVVIDSENKKDTQILKKLSENTKHTLSFSSSTNIIIDSINGQDKILNLSRNKYNELTKAWFRDLESMILQINNKNINNIILIGGSSRCPQIRNICNKLFPGIRISSTINPDEAVSIGACLQAGLLCKKDSDNDCDVLLIDIIPLSIGIETHGGLFTPLISKNTEIPASVKSIFTNDTSNIDSIEIKIYQGERRFARDNYLLGSFTLKNLDTSKLKGEMHIEIYITIDENSILKAHAKDLDTDNTIHIIFDAINHNSEYIRDMIDQSEKNKIEDTVKYNIFCKKMELQQKYDELYKIYEDRILYLNEIQILKLNNLFRKVKKIISFETEMQIQDIQTALDTFAEEWHNYMLL